MDGPIGVPQAWRQVRPRGTTQRPICDASECQADRLTDPCANRDVIGEHHEIARRRGVRVNLPDLSEEIGELHRQDTGVGPVGTVTKTSPSCTSITSLGVSLYDTWWRPSTRTR